MEGSRTFDLHHRQPRLPLSLFRRYRAEIDEHELVRCVLFLEPTECLRCRNGEIQRHGTVVLLPHLRVRRGAGDADRPDDSVGALELIQERGRIFEEVFVEDDLELRGGWRRMEVGRERASKEEGQARDERVTERLEEDLGSHDPVCTFAMETSSGSTLWSRREGEELACEDEVHVERLRERDWDSTGAKET